jgi:toxin ParE1/3/4
VSAFTVEWAGPALDDIEAIADYIAHESAQRALQVIESLEERARSLRVFPTRGRIVPELRRQGERAFQEIHAWPWRLIYRIDGHRVMVMAVLDGRRDLETVLLERLVR